MFARKLRDGIPCKPEDLRLRPEWVLTREAREIVLSKRHEVCISKWEEHTKALSPLSVGMCVQVQNQAGPHRNKWEVSGIVVEVLGHEAYNVKMDGSGRVSRRHRRFLRPIVPYSDVVVGRVLVRGPQEFERAPNKDNTCTPASCIVDVTNVDDSNSVIQGVEIDRIGGQGLVPGAGAGVDARSLERVPGGGAPAEVVTSPAESQDGTHGFRRSVRGRFQPDFYDNCETINALGGGA